MFDFRYHALSLVAVFIALAVGLLLGVAIGDSGLVSSAERDIRKSLRSDVRKANHRADDLRGELDASRRYEREVYPLLVGGQLEGAQVGLVFLGRPSEALADHVRAALDSTGAALASVAVVGEPLDREAVARRAGDTRYRDLAGPGDPDLTMVEALGVRMAAQYVVPRALIRRERTALFDAFNGDLKSLNAIVVVRAQPDGLSDVDDRVADRFEDGFARGLRESGVPVAGVETTTTDPSQISWYGDRHLTSVDNVDQPPGRAALVFALQGARGTFGVKPTAQALLPDVAGGTSP